MSAVWIIDGTLRVNIDNGDSYGIHVQRVKFEADGSVTALSQAARFKVDGDLQIANDEENNAASEL